MKRIYETCENRLKARSFRILLSLFATFIRNVGLKQIDTPEGEASRDKEWTRKGVNSFDPLSLRYSRETE